MNDLFQRRSIGSPEALDVVVCKPMADRGVPHAFSLRWRKWESEEPFGARDRGDQDREELAGALGLETLAHMRQVHGSEVQAIDEAPLTLLVCDGLATTRKGLALIVHTADCVPLVLWDEDTGAVAAVHAGWRGALAGVSRSAAAFLAKRFGSRAESIHVAMGPSIGACCYEVGEEVVRAFDQQVSYGSDLFSPGPRGRSHLNLIEANSRQLTEYGVPREQIYSSGMCTSCDNGRLYSYRKEGTGVGRLMGVIGVG